LERSDNPGIRTLNSHSTLKGFAIDVFIQISTDVSKTKGTKIDVAWISCAFCAALWQHVPEGEG
jgi:hypothetical protein